MNKEKGIIGLIIGVLCLCALVVVINFISYQNGYEKGLRESVNYTDTVVKTKIDTLKCTETDTLLKKEYVVRNETLEIERIDTFLKDGFEITLPITQKEYRDSTFTAYVSGYKPNLDSILIFNKTTTVEAVKYRNKKWNFGLQAGYGFGFLSKQFEPYVGFGFTYNF